MYLIDSDILIWVLRNNQKYLDLIQRFKDKSALSISVITVTEIYKNVYPSELLRTQEVVDGFVKWDLTSDIAKQGGLYWQQFSKRFKNLNIMDCLIAATAREYNLTLLSLNYRHFPMKDIKVYDPLKN